jgi:transcriptional regulator with XRE-family HTH domain
LYSVNQEVRKQVKAAMKAKGLTQQALADELGVKRVYVNRMLSGDTSNVPGRWSDLLTLLGLELTVKPKGQE